MFLKLSGNSQHCDAEGKTMNCVYGRPNSMCLIEASEDVYNR